MSSPDPNISRSPSKVADPPSKNPDPPSKTPDPPSKLPSSPSIPAPTNPIEARFNVISKYHYLVFLLLFTSKVPALWHVLNLMILNPPMSYTCGPGGEVNACPCDDPVWDRSVFTETAQTKFGLICNKKFSISLSESLAYFGMLVGALLFGVLADRYGRLFMFSVSYLTVGVSGILIGVSPNVAFFCIFRFLEGVGAGGTIVTSFVLCIEYAGTRFRETITALYHLPINVGHITIAGVSYLFRNSFTFQLVISIPMIIYACSWFLIRESPKWLLDNNRKEKAIAAMEKIAQFNKKPDPTIRADIEAYYSRRTAQQEVKMKVYHIFKYKKITRNFLCMAYLYFVCGMGFYGVSHYISKMSGNVHLNIVLSGLLVVPGTIASVFLLNRIGRKPFLITTGIVSGVFMLIAVAIPKTFNPAWLVVIFACISNCFFFMSFIIVFLYGVELFPTQVRNSCLGVLSLLSRAGMMSAPLINAQSPIVSGCMFGIMALVGGILAFCLPETKNKDLPSTLEEAETMF